MVELTSSAHTVICVRKRLLRGFSLAELIIVIVVLGIISTIAFVGFQQIIKRSDNERVKEQTRTWVRQSQALYALKTPSDPNYTWEQALLDVAADLPPYSQVGSSALASGAQAEDSTVNGWRVQSDPTDNDSVYSTGPNHIVLRTSGSTMYFAVASGQSASSIVKGVFGVITERGTATLWTSNCSAQTCDAGSAYSGPQASGSYGTSVPGSIAGGTTTTAPTTTSVGGATTTASTTTTVGATTTTAAPTTTVAATTTTTTTTTTTAPPPSAPTPPSSLVLSETAAESGLLQLAAAGGLARGSLVTSIDASCTATGYPTLTYAWTSSLGTNVNGAYSAVSRAWTTGVAGAIYVCSLTATNSVGTSTAATAAYYVYPYPYPYPGFYATPETTTYPYPGHYATPPYGTPEYATPAYATPPYGTPEYAYPYPENYAYPEHYPYPGHYAYPYPDHYPGPA